jgi:hypothetical protein
MSKALSRTCNLADFPACDSAAMWQQCLAVEAWARWITMQHLRTRDGSLVVNYSPGPFEAPGPTAVYRYRGQVYAEDDVQPPVPAVFGLGVLDRIAAPVSFLTHAGQLLGPRGLLVLTFSYWDAEGPDTARGHHERCRIYSAHSYQRLIRDARRVGFTTWGGVDWTYHGNVLDDHSLASLVLIKREGETHGDRDRDAPAGGAGGDSGGPAD